MRSVAAVFVSVLPILTACGGGSAPAPNAPEPTPTAAAPSDAGAAPAKPTASPAASMDSHREPFIQMCMKGMPNPDYCECAWGEFKVVFKDEDLSKEPAPNDPRIKQLQERTAATCASKLSEADLKKTTVDSCVKDDKKRTPYCECKWNTIRKHLSIADFVSPATEPSPRLIDALKEVPKACKGKLTKEMFKTDFIGECTKGGKPQKVCECAFTKFVAKYTPEEIDNGLADPKAIPGLDTCK
jgi:hypothetical protein